MSEIASAEPERHDLLARLAPRELEDFITTAFCWLLERTEFGKYFLDRLEERMANNAAITGSARNYCTWHTQYVLGGTRKRPDMVCITRDRKARIFEHKVEAELHDGQLEGYGRIAGQRFAKSAVVLVTKRTDQCAQNPDCHVLWRQVYDWVSRWLRDLDGNRFGLAAAFNFLYLLKMNGMGPMDRIEARQLAAIPVARVGERWIASLVSRMAEAWPDEPVSSPLKRPEGRGGLFLLGDGTPATWNPDIFVGVMVDGRDHGPPAVNEIVGGPVACVVLDIHQRWEYEDMASYQALAEWACVDWVSGHPSWTVFSSRNRYHPVMAYKPLYDVVGRAATGEAQLEAFVEELLSMATALREQPVFHSFRHDLQGGGPGCL